MVDKSRDSAEFLMAFVASERRKNVMRLFQMFVVDPLQAGWKLTNGAVESMKTLLVFN